MDHADESYLGSGNILIREYGAAAPLIEVGNCSKADLSPEVESKRLQDFTLPGAGPRNEVDRLTGINFAYAFHDFDAPNFARTMRAGSTTIAAATVTDEHLVAYKGGYTSAAKIIDAVTNIEPVGGGTAYTVNTDYELRDGMVFIPSGSTIPDPVAGAANCQITYTHLAQKKLEAFVNPNKQYEVVIVGLNEAQNGKKARITLHKVKGGVIKTMAVLGSDYGAGEVEGGLMRDPTKGSGKSSYYTVELED